VPLALGARVRHARLGSGAIVETGERSAVVEFPVAGGAGSRRGSWWRSRPVRSTRLDSGFCN
jgi:hypothetical protein